MKQKLISLCLLPLLAFSHWAMDFDEDFAAASSAWTPLKLGDKLTVWFDASDNATVLNADGNPAADAEAVQTWLDKSGNARHATAPASGQRPSYRTAAQNGRAVLRTDGGDLMSITNLASVFRNKTAGYLFAVAKDANHSGGDSIHGAVVFMATGVFTLFGTYSRSVAGKGWAARGRRLTSDSLVNAYCGPVYGHVLSLSFADWSGGFIRSSTNNAACASTAYSSGAGSSEDVDTTEGLLFGASSGVNQYMPANSEIAEVVIVNAAMTDAEITALQTYLKNKWGTP